MHALIIDRQIDANNRRRVKTLQRAFTVVARFAMFLDGGPSRVRTGDVDGTE